MVAQVRAAQAQPAAAPASVPLEKQPEIGTPCNAKELGELHAALVESGKGRMEVVEQSIASGSIADLRLVEALIHAMGDSYLGDRIADGAIPRLGAAIIAPIRALLSIEKGRKIDARRLRALVAVQKAEARDLLAEALTKGNAEMREAALDAIADHVRGIPEFEPLVLALIAKERTGGVFRAALRALSGYASDASLEALRASLDDARTLKAAAEGLGHSRHPQALTWMLERLAVAVTAAAKARKTKKDPEAKTPANQVEPETMVTTLLEALAKQEDPRVATTAMALIKDYGQVAAKAALKSADPKQLGAIADLLAGNDEELFPVAAEAASRLDADQAFKRLSAAFTAKDREKKIGLARLEAISDHLAKTTDPRWCALCLKQLDGPRPIALFAMPVLGAQKERKAIKPLQAIIASEKNPKVLAAAIEALGGIGDSSSVDAILAHQGHKEWAVRYAVQHALVAIDDPSSVDKVRTIYVGLKTPNSYDHWHLRSLLQHLERRFPGK
jgi:hypothetical protein